MPLFGESSTRQGFSGAGGSYVIDNSLIFDGSSSYLDQTTGAGTSLAGTLSFWVKRSKLGADQQLFHARTSSGSSQLRFQSDDTLYWRLEATAGSQVGQLTTNRVFRDTSAWYHIVANFNTANGTAGNRMRIYVNGVEETSFSTDTNPAAGLATSISSAGGTHYIGATHGPADYFGGYLAEYVFLDGTQSGPTSFGEFDDNAVWNPKDLSDNFTVSTTAEAIVNTTSEVSTGDLTTYTYNNVSLGTASATRAVYVFVTAQEPGTAPPDIQTLTVGGVSAGIVADVSNSVEPQYYVSELWRADVPSGTTGNIVVTWNTAMSQCGISVWSVTGDHHLFDLKTDLTNETTTVSFENVPDNSVILAGRGSSGSVTHTWSADVTENVDQTIEGSVTHSAASQFHATGGSKTVTCTPSGTDSRSRMAALVLSPNQGGGVNGFHVDFELAALLGKSSISSKTTTSTHLGSQTFTNDTTAYTVSSATLGAAASNRSILLAVGGGRSSSGARTVSSVTVGGTAATFVARQQSGAGNVTEFWRVHLPTGTSGDIVATFSATMTAVGISWWRVLNLGNTISTAGNTASGWSTQAVTTIGQAGDIAWYAIYDEGDADAYAWSNATERSEHIDIESTRSWTSADYTFSASESHAETATISGGSGNDGAFLGVTFSNNNTFELNNVAAADQTNDTPTDSS